jgi:hypothetical protein
LDGGNEGNVVGDLVESELGSVDGMMLYDGRTSDGANEGVEDCTMEGVVLGIAEDQIRTSVLAVG